MKNITKRTNDTSIILVQHINPTTLTLNWIDRPNKHLWCWWSYHSHRRQLDQQYQLQWVKRSHSYHPLLWPKLFGSYCQLKTRWHDHIQPILFLPMLCFSNWNIKKGHSLKRIEIYWNVAIKYILIYWNRKSEMQWMPTWPSERYNENQGNNLTIKEAKKNMYLLMVIVRLIFHILFFASFPTVDQQLVRLQHVSSAGWVRSTTGGRIFFFLVGIFICCRNG